LLMVNGFKYAKILVVEDEKYMRDLYIKLLQEEGYEVDWAADGVSAYEKIIPGKYDLVLLDLMLPKMDGISIIKKLLEKYKSINNLPKIVVLTNLGTDKIMMEAITLGVRGYILKSEVTPDKILLELKNYLNQ